MTNKEFYFDKLLAVALKRACRKLRKAVFGKTCLGKNCGECEFSTAESIENWLNAEHEEPELPLLKNGDSLQPGDWIMVRDNEDCNWYKRQFMCYFNHSFYCVNNIEQTMDEYIIFNASSWAQARLPMEGE